MNFTEFVTWIKEQKINDAVKHEILHADIDDPKAYVANMRRLIKGLIDKKTRITGVTYANYYKKLDQIYQDLLSPVFLESIPTAIAIKKAQHRRETAKDRVIEMLSDPVKLNAAIRGRDVITLPAGSDYANRDNYLGYLLSQDFKPTEMKRSNAGRLPGFLKQAFGEEAALAHGLQDGIFDTNDNVELSRFAIMLEAALYAVQADYMDEDAPENTAIHDREDLTDSVPGMDPEIHPGQKQQLRRAMMNSWHPISLDGVLKGHLDELSSQLGSIIAAYPAIIKCYKALARLQNMQAEAAAHKELRDVNVGIVKEMIVKIPFVGYQPHELVNAYNDLTDRCDGYYQRIAALKEKDAKAAVEEFLKSLQQIREIANNAKVVDGKRVFFSSDQEELRVSILKKFKKISEVVYLLLPPGAGGDVLLPIYINLISSVFEKYSNLFTDKDFLPLLSDSELCSALFHRRRKDFDILVTRGETLTAEQQVKAGEISDIASYADYMFTATLLNAVQAVRAAWLWNSTQGEINADDIGLVDAQSVYDYRFGILEEEASAIERSASNTEEKEFLRSVMKSVIKQFSGQVKTLQGTENAPLKQTWLDLAKEVSAINLAEIAQQALHAEHERMRNPAQPAPLDEASGDSKGKEELYPDKQKHDEPKVEDKREPDVSRVDVSDEEGEESEAKAQVENVTAAPAPEKGGAPVQPGMVDVSDDPKINDLKTACDEYMIHLGRDIYASIRDDDFELCKQLVIRPAPDSRLRFYARGMTDPSPENVERVALLRQRNENLDVAIKKYIAVREMKETLFDNTPSPKRLANFEIAFKANRKTIEQRRDSGVVLFLKRLATAFFGIGYFAGLWKVKGREFSSNVEERLHPSNGKKPK